MLGCNIMKGLMFVLCFLMWDFYFKDTFYGWILGESETAGLAEVAMGYGLVFVAAFILGEVVTRALGLNESEVREAY